MNITLKRLSTGSQGTFGSLLYKNIPLVQTLEREWLDNAVGKSCIPQGTYTCRRVQSPRFGNTFEVTDVEGRTHILFHKGNLDDDSHGCILIGKQNGSLGEDRGILSSKQGFNEFMLLLENKDEFELEIIDCF
jgi:hypothetical protein